MKRVEDDGKKRNRLEPDSPLFLYRSGGNMSCPNCRGGTSRTLDIYGVPWEMCGNPLCGWEVIIKAHTRPSEIYRRNPGELKGSVKESQTKKSLVKLKKRLKRMSLQKAIGLFKKECQKKKNMPFFYDSVMQLDICEISENRWIQMEAK